MDIDQMQQPTPGPQPPQPPTPQPQPPTPPTPRPPTPTTPRPPTPPTPQPPSPLSLQFEQQTNNDFFESQEFYDDLNKSWSSRTEGKGTAWRVLRGAKKHRRWWGSSIHSTKNARFKNICFAVQKWIRQPNCCTQKSMETTRRMASTSAKALSNRATMTKKSFLIQKLPCPQQKND